LKNHLEQYSKVDSFYKKATLLIQLKSLA
jgi:hypothetical protein